MIHEADIVCHNMNGRQNLRLPYPKQRVLKPEAQAKEPAHSPRSRVLKLHISVWPKAFDHRSLGHRPRKSNRNTSFLAEGHTQIAANATDEYGLRPKKLVLSTNRGALPHATVKNGLRPNCVIELCNYLGRVGLSPWMWRVAETETIRGARFGLGKAPWQWSAARSADVSQSRYSPGLRKCSCYSLFLTPGC